MIDHLLAELGEKLDLTAEELADVIWLSLIRQEGTLTDDEGLEPKSKTAATVKPSGALAPVSPPPPSQTTTPQYPATVGSSTGIISPRSSTTNTVLNRLPIKVANPPSLRNPLALARSLRPLMQKVPSGRIEGLDEQATAQQIAEAGIWQPIVKPVLEPWFEIALVVDESASMLIWRQTVLEFRKLLRNYGAFRDVQLWGLHCEEGSLYLRPGIGSEALQQLTRQPEELLDPSGRRLILLITDCVSSYWQEEMLIKTLKRWAQQSPIAIAQVLPEWLWVRTAIRGFESVQLAGLEPGVPNSQLVVDWSSVWQSVANPQSGVCLPIVPLEPDSVLTWSRMVMGQCAAPGYWLRSFPTETDLPASSSRFPAQQLERFQLISSPVAQRLMGLVAASPVITLPVIRLIQETLLPKSQQMHVAEVLLGGLLEPIIPPQLGTIPDEMEYRFVDEAIRDLLLAETPVPDTVQVLSGYVERQFDQSLDEFVAELQLWSQNEDLALVNKARSFATVTAAVLKRKGGRYREFVQQVERQTQHQAAEETAQSKSVIESDQQEVVLAPVWVCELSFSAHEKNVTCACFNPNGLSIASSSDDSTIRLWDLQGNQIAQLIGHSGFVHSIAISPNGSWIISASEDATVRVWSLDGTLLRTLEGHTGTVCSVAFSPDSQTIISGSGDKTVRVWSIDGTLLRTLEGHTGTVCSVAFSPDGNTIVSGSGDKTVRVWRIDGTLLRTLEGHTDTVWSVAFSPDGNTIVSGSGDQTARVWELSGGQSIHTLLGHTGTIYSVAFSPDGQLLISGSQDRTIRVWSRDGSSVSEPLQAHEGGVNSVAFSPDGRMLVSCSGDKSINLWRSQEDEVAAAKPDVPLPVFDEPGGQVPLDSAFYIERPSIEVRCYEEILKPGALIRITAPRQMGKSSLMLRILNHAREQGYQVVSLDFQLLDRSSLNSLDQFLQWFCISVAEELNLEHRLEDFWRGVRGSKLKCTNYFQRYLLPELRRPIVLCLDEVDVLFQVQELRTNFLGMLRAWHEKGKSQPPWGDLRLVIGYSKEVYIPLDVNQSPFNVGLPIELPHLTIPQVMDLSQRHGLNWAQTEATQFMDMLGGQPYLVRAALHKIARGELSLEQLLQVAPTESGLYGEYLRRHLLNLEGDERLLAAMKQIIAVDRPVSINRSEAFMLTSMGLVKFQGNDVVPICDLYRLYFRERLLTSDRSDTQLETTEQPLIVELKAALAIVDEQERTATLSHLMARSPEVPSNLLHRLSTIENEVDRVSALIALIPHLPDTLLSNALEIVRTIQDVFSRFQGLAILAALLPEVVPEALQSALEIEDESTRLRALTSVVEELPSELLPQALQAARTINDTFSRARALIALVDKLPDAASQALEVTLEIEHEYSRARALRELVPHLPNALLPNALAAAMAIQQETVRNDLLRDLIPLLPETLRQQLNLATETPKRISLWQEGNTQIYALCTSTPWNLPFDALVTPVGIQGGLGTLAAAFQDFLGMNSDWLSETISETMRANKLRLIKPDQPLLVRLPSQINAQISSLTGSTSERLLICATSELEDEPSSANTFTAYKAVVQLAVDRRFRRLIVPLIGTGTNQLPVDEVATGMLKAINDVLKSLRSTSLEEITIVDRNEDKIATIISSNPEVKAILFLTANPKDTGRLRLDQELRDIAEGLQRAQQRDHFTLEQRWAVRPRDIQRAMLDVNPQIVHFSGHGAGEQGLLFEDELGNAKLVDGAALAGLFELFADQIQCVVLNGCYSDVQAQAIAHHIPYVIGMNQEIGDRAAIAFAVGFYDALGAGRPIEFAYKLGCSAIRLEGVAEHLTPVLLKQTISPKAIAPSKPTVIPPSPPPASAAATANVPIEVFISYSHKDETLKDELYIHLANLKRQGKIQPWQDRAIEAGMEWDAEIKARLESAGVILLLITPRFIASDTNLRLKTSLSCEEN